MNPTYTKKNTRLARLLLALFALSMLMTVVASIAPTANAAETTAPNVSYSILNTSGSVPDSMSDAYTVSTGSTVTFEVDITNITRPEMVSIVNTEGTQFQHIDSLIALDQNNQEIHWNYNNSVPMDNLVEINATGLPDNVYRIIVQYTCSVLESGAESTEGIYGQTLYLDNGVTHTLESEERLFGLTFQIATIDSTMHTNLNPENAPNHLTTGNYSLYYNADMTKPVRFVQSGDIFQAIAEWDNRGKNYIEIASSGTANIQGLASGVYYLKQMIPPENYSDYQDTIELQLYAKKSGNGVTTNLKILNDADVQLQPIKVATSGNSLTLDYAGQKSMLRQIQTTLMRNMAPMVGIAFILAAGVAIYIRTNRQKGQTE